MPALLDFLEPLWREGRAIVVEPPLLVRDDQPHIIRWLTSTFDEDALDLAGTPPKFHPEQALAAAMFTWRACWFLVRREANSSEMLKMLPIPRCLGAAGSHASADLIFRFLPQIHRRATAIAGEDPLATRIAETLRAWPLSGVLAEIDEAPTTSLDFQGHLGLEIRYAERWIGRRVALWKPAFATLDLVTESVHAR